MMEEQSTQTQSAYRWQAVNSTTYFREYFHQLHKDFKLRLTCTLQLPKSLHVHGRLIFNNGSTVPISISHHSTVNLFLNKQKQPIRKTVIYSIDMNSETLTFSAKISAVKGLQIADKWLELIEQEINSQKRLITALLIVIGIPIDSEHVTMRKVLIQKKMLKNELLKLFNSPLQQIAHLKRSDLKSTMEDETLDRAVIAFGPNQDTQIRQLKLNEMTVDQKNIKHKKMDGGYFAIDESIYEIQGEGGGTKVLAKKTLKDRRKADSVRRQINDKKLKKQLQIVKEIKDKNYLLKYYYQESETIEYILMEKYDQSLQEYIYYMGDSIQLPSKLGIAKQIVESVLSLHHSGVIHRDVKPSNFLLNDCNDRADKYQLKIIDFAESYCDKLKDKDGDYACSHPYSPIECSDRKGVGDIGVSRMEIDYWSVGMTIFELFFRKLPVSFSRAFLTDITASWKTELLLTVDQRQKCGLRVVEDIITIICVKTLKFEQEKRMDLYLMHNILQMLEKYVGDLMKLLEETN